MTWSSSGSSEKWGILLAHSTRVKSCLSAAWQIFVTGSLGCREKHADTNLEVRNPGDAWNEKVSCFCFIVCVCLLAKSLVSRRATYHHMHIHAYTSATLWIISSEEKLVGRQNKQWFCPSSWRKYLQRAAGEKTTFTKQALSLGTF